MAATVPVRAKSRLSRGAFAGLGCLFVTMGAIGVFVPVWPTTIFCILALWCFKKSSARLEHWLLANRLMGATLRDWEESRSLTLRAKLLAIGTIWLSIGASIYFVQKPWVQGMLLAIAAALTVYLGTRPTKERIAA